MVDRMTMAIACGACHAPVHGKFCQECGAPRPAEGGASAGAQGAQAGPGANDGLAARVAGARVKGGGSAGRVLDRQTGPRGAKVFFECVVGVDDGAALGRWSRGAGGDEQAVLQHVKTACLDAVKSTLEARLRDGTWSATAIESGELTSTVSSASAEAYAKANVVPGTSVSFESMTVMFDPPKPKPAAAGAAAAPAASAADARAAPAAPAPAHAAPTPAAAADPAPGARVLVQWSDGNRYPAVVQQAAAGQCLVAFPNGQTQWVPAAYLSPAG
jgi:hypothetical protein